MKTFNHDNVMKLVHKQLSRRRELPMSSYDDFVHLRAEAFFFPKEKKKTCLTSCLHILAEKESGLFPLSQNVNVMDMFL